MASKLKSKEVDALFSAILSLKSTEECYAFFEDLCTLQEVREMAKRLRAAKLLEEGVVYTKIAQLTGLSTATISRVNRCLKDGAGGYRAVLKNSEEQ